MNCWSPTRQLAGLGQRLGRIAGARPLVLAFEQHVEEAEIPLRVGAAGQHGGLERCPVEREVAEHQLDLAGVDEVLLELRQRIGVEAGAMRAGQEEYSRIVIGALGSPSTRSLKGSFFSAAWATWVLAFACA